MQPAIGQTGGSVPVGGGVPRRAPKIGVKAAEFPLDQPLTTP